MQVSVETTQGLGRKMTITVPGERIETEVKQRLKSMAPKVKMAGFRPGKVPMKVVEQNYGGQVRREVMGEVVSNTFYEAVAQENLRPAGQPDIQTTRADTDSLEYEAIFEVYPEIELNNISSIAIERPVAALADTDLESMLDKIRAQRKDWQESDNAAAADDRVTLDYDATINGESFEGGNGKDMQVVIGSKSMIAGFEDALIGLKPGDEKTVDLTFPDDYRATDVAGKPAQFVLKINKVETGSLPELNDELAESFGVKEGGVEALKTDIKNNMQRELDGAVRKKLKNQVMDALLENTEFDVPEAMVQAEAKRFVEQMQGQVQMQGGKASISDELVNSESMQQQAKRRVSLGLVLSEIIRQNEMQADPAKVKAEVETIAAQYGDPKEVIKWYASNRERMQEVESIVLEDQVVDWVMEQAKITDKNMSFDEVVRGA